MIALSVGSMTIQQSTADVPAIAGPIAGVEGRVAVVTGGSRGIGRAIAEALAAAGAQVLITSRKADDLEVAAREIGHGTMTFAAHAGRAEAIDACLDFCLAHLGSPDILVNNAATNPHFGPLAQCPPSAFDKIFEVNVRGPLLWIQGALSRGMGEQRQGVVINLASIGGMTFGGPIGAYDCSKAALIHMTKHFATELGPKIRVNAIAPGLVKTDMARALWESGTGDALAAQWPLRRMGNPSDIAALALFLASDSASWMTGDVLVCDGGALLGGFGV